MPSPEAIEAMERIARDKAGTPEGDVASRKLQKLDVMAQETSAQARPVLFWNQLTEAQRMAWRMAEQAVAHKWMREIDLELLAHTMKGVADAVADIQAESATQGS